MAGKAYRLSKLAREFNVSTATIVDYLAEKGHSIESSPNTKLDGQMYDLLLQEFQSEKSLKEKSQKTASRPERRETISLEDSSNETSTSSKEEEENIPLVDEILSRGKDSKEEESKPEEPKTPVVEPTESDDDSDVKVIGKIDLTSINQKTRPSKKAKEEPKKTEAPKKADKVSAKKKADELAKAKRKSAKEEAIKMLEAERKALEERKARKEAKGSTYVPQKTEAPEKIETKVEQLSGPKVLGKIELPTVKKKETSSDDKKEKRKRKRVKKVDVAKAAQDNRRQGGGQRGRRRGAPVKKEEISQEDVQKKIKETLDRLSGGGKNKGAKFRREKRDERRERREEELIRAEEASKTLKVTEFVTVSEIATMMEVSSTDVIASLMSIGIFASINQRLDAETIQLLAEDKGFEVEFVGAEVSDSIQEEEDKEEDLIERPPIVTVMGHVDHGKTSLLDHVRKANVIAGEAGGITQHIGAYSVELDNGKRIAFLDTPGHEAFTAMRARGAQVTDVAIIIVAADDDVMPQTKEAINHAQAAGVPMVFAINKIDKPGANPDKIREQLSGMNILVEDWGGKYQVQEISAKKGTGIDELLDKVLLEAELLELKANPNKNAVGSVIEASLDKGKGFVSTIMVQAGTLKVGDFVLAGSYYGKVKAMENERGQRIKEAGPSTPVSLLGLNGAPSAGDKFNVLQDEKEAKSIASKREQLQREQGLRTQKHITLDEIGRRLAIGDFQELNVIVKGDVDGSIEALSDSLQKLSTEEIQVNIIHKAVGQISESDVLLASASDAIIVGFQVRPSAQARKIAEAEEIDIRLYSIIYTAIDELKSAMEGMLSPEIKEEITGSAEVRDTFKISKVGTVAGCYVTEGKIYRHSKVRLIREGIVIYTGDLGQLKRFKDDVKDVSTGYECGMSIKNYNDIKVGDVFEAYNEVEVQRKLSSN